MLETMSSQVRRFCRSEDGPTAIEYAVILALLILGIIAGISFMRTGMQTVLTRAGDVMESPPPIAM